MLYYHLLERPSFLHVIAFVPSSKVRKHICVGQLHGSLFCSTGFWASPLPVPVQPDYCSRIRSSQICRVTPPCHSSKIVVAILGPVPFCMNFRISPPVFTKIFAGVLIDMSLNPKVYLEKNTLILGSQTLSWDHNGV